jgi:hypothetical protein
MQTEKRPVDFWSVGALVWRWVRHELYRPHLTHPNWWLRNREALLANLPLHLASLFGALDVLTGLGFVSTSTGVAESLVESLATSVEVTVRHFVTPQMCCMVKHIFSQREEEVNDLPSGALPEEEPCCCRR